MRNFESGFHIYIKLAKKLAFRIPDTKDRVKAIKWFKKIASVENEDDKKIQNHALQLFLICLQRKMLVGPFKKFPEKDIPFASYDWSYQPADIARDILQAEFEEHGQPPVTFQLSGDLCEYVAYQDIPQFGSHFYYACSPEELPKWNNLREDIIPKNLLMTTAVSSPETSVLARTVVEDTENRRRALFLSKPAQLKKSDEFIDATMIDDQGKIKEPFLKEQPTIIDDIVKNDLLEDAVAVGIVEEADLRFGEDIRPDNEKIGSPHIESVVITKDGKKVFEKSSVKNVSGKEKKKIEDFQKIVGERQAEGKENVQLQGGEIREDLLQQMPPRLRKRLAKKFVPKELQKYIPPSLTTRRSPIWRGLPRSTTVEKSVIQKPKTSRTTETPTPVEDKEIEKSFERSMAEIRKRRQEPEVLIQRPNEFSSRRKRLLERLRKLRESQPRQLVFEEGHIEIEPEEVQFEKFVYQELPKEEEPAKDVTILRDEDMPIDDIFGVDQILTPHRPPPTPQSLDELRSPGILLEAEMPIEDLFPEEQVADPKVVFKEVRVEDEYKTGEETATVIKGARILQMPGREPMIQRFVEEKSDKTGEGFPLTSPLKTPKLDKYLASKRDLQKGAGPLSDIVREHTLPPEQMPPELPTEEIHRRNLEYIRETKQSHHSPAEHAHELITQFEKRMVYMDASADKTPMKYDSDFEDRSILREDEMQFSDIFGESQVSPPFMPREPPPVSHFQDEMYPSEKIDRSYLDVHEMVTDDMFGEDHVLYPQKYRSPERGIGQSRLRDQGFEPSYFKPDQDRALPPPPLSSPASRRHQLEQLYGTNLTEGAMEDMFKEDMEGMLPTERLEDISLPEMDYSELSEKSSKGGSKISGREDRAVDELERLKTRLRTLKGLPTVQKKTPNTRQDDLLDPLEFNLPPESFQKGLLDESLPSHLQSPLIEPPTKPNIFASFERQFEDTLGRDIEDPGERSIFSPEEMEDLFDESLVAQYIPPWHFSPLPRRAPTAPEEVSRKEQDTPYITPERIEEVSFPEISQSFIEFIPSGYGEPFQQRSPKYSTETSKELRKKEDRSILEGGQMMPDDGGGLVVPSGRFGVSPRVSKVADQRRIMANRLRSLRGLSPLDVSEPMLRLNQLVDFKRKIDESMRSILSEAEMADLFDDEAMIAGYLPGWSRSPSATMKIVSTRKIERISSPFRAFIPSGFQGIEAELIDDQSFPTIYESLKHPSQLSRRGATPVLLPDEQVPAMEDLERVSFPQYTEPSSFYEAPSILQEEDMADMFTPQQIAHPSQLPRLRTYPFSSPTGKVRPMEDLERVSFPQYTEPSSFYEPPSILAEEDMADMFTPQQIAHPSQFRRLRTSPFSSPTGKVRPMEDLERVSFPQYTEPSSFYEPPSILAEEDMADMFTPQQIAHPSQFRRLRTSPFSSPTGKVRPMEDLERVSFPQYTEPSSFYEPPSILAEEDMADMFTPQQIAHPSQLPRLRTYPFSSPTGKVRPMEDLERVSFPQYTEPSSFYEPPSILAEEGMADMFTPQQLAHPSQLPRLRTSPFSSPTGKVRPMEDLERVSFPQYTEPSSFYEPPSILAEEDMADMFTPQQIAHPSQLPRLRTFSSPTGKVRPMEDLERVSFPQYTEPSSFFEPPSILAEEDMADMFTPQQIAHPSQLPKLRTSSVPLPMIQLMEDLERVSFPQYEEPSSLHEVLSILADEEMADMFTPQQIAHPSQLRRLRTTPFSSPTGKVRPMEVLERVSFPQYTEPSSFYEPPSILKEDDMADMFTPQQFAHPSQLPRLRTSPFSSPTGKVRPMEDLERVSFPQYTEPSSFYEPPSILAEEDMADMFTPQQIAHPSQLPRLRTSPFSSPTGKERPMEDLERVSFPQYTEPSSFYEPPSILAEEDMADMFTPQQIAHPSQFRRLRTSPFSSPTGKVRPMEDLERVSFPQYTEPSSFYEPPSILAEEDMADMFTPQQIAHPSQLPRLRTSPFSSPTGKERPMEDLERVSFPQYTEPSSFYEPPSILAEEDMADMFTPQQIAHPSQFRRLRTSPFSSPTGKVRPMEDLERVSFPQYTEPSSFYEPPSILAEEDMADMFTPQRIAHPSQFRRLRTSPFASPTGKVRPMEDLERVSFPQYTEPSSFFEPPSILAEEDMADMFTPQQIAHPSQLPKLRTSSVPLPMIQLMEDLERVSFPQYEEPSSLHEVLSILADEEMADMFTPQQIAHPSQLRRLRTTPFSSPTGKVRPREVLERVSFPQYTEPSSFYEPPSILKEDDMADMFTPQQFAHPSQLPRLRTSPFSSPTGKVRPMEDLERVSFPQYTEPSSFYEPPSILAEEDMADMFTPQQIAHPSQLPRLRTSPFSSPTGKVRPMEDLERVSFPQYTEPSSFFEPPSILAEEDMADMFTPQQIAHPSQFRRLRTSPFASPTGKVRPMEVLERVSFPQYTEPSSLYEPPSILEEDDMADMFTPQQIAHPSQFRRLRTSPFSSPTGKVRPMEDLERVSYPRYTEPSSFFEPPSILAEEDMADMFTPQQIAHPSQLPRLRTSPFSSPTGKVRQMEDLESVSFPKYTEPSSFYEPPSILAEEDMADMFTPQQIAHPSQFRRLRTSPFASPTGKVRPMEDLERVSFPQYTEPNSIYKVPTLPTEGEVDYELPPEQYAVRTSALHYNVGGASPEIIHFREVASGVLEPEASEDWLLSRQHKERQMMQDIPSEQLDLLSPPPFEGSYSSVEDERIIESPGKFMSRFSQRRRLFAPPEALSQRKTTEEEFHKIAGGDYTEFPADEELFEVSLGPLARALYIPREEEEAEFESYRLAHANVSPIVIPTPPRRPPFLPDASPIGRTDVLPHEEGFKWLGNYVPFEEQVRPKGKSTRRQTVASRRTDRPLKKPDNLQNDRREKDRKPASSRARTTRADKNATPVTTRSEIDITKTKKPTSNVTTLRSKSSHRAVPRPRIETGETGAAGQKTRIGRRSVSKQISANKTGQSRITKVKSTVENTAGGIPTRKYTKEDISTIRKPGQVDRTRSAVSVTKGLR